MTAADILNMPKEKSDLLNEILSSWPNTETIKYCLKKKYMKAKSPSEIVWDGMVVFQLPLEERRRAGSIGGLNNGSNIPVVMLTVDGGYVAEYRSANEAHQKTGIDGSSIRKVIKGSRCSTGGYIFVSKKDYDPSKEYKIKPYKTNYNTWIMKKLKSNLVTGLQCLENI